MIELNVNNLITITWKILGQTKTPLNHEKTGYQGY